MHYSRISTGTLHGKLIVQWLDRDKFLFLRADFGSATVGMGPCFLELDAHGLIQALERVLHTR